MAYKLYTDKSEVFECELNVKNASLKNSMARLLVESDDVTLVFNGKIKDSKCTIPIKKLKGLLNENSSGNIYLEVIVDDTYFSPWKDNYTVEEHTTVKVKVAEQKETFKPLVEVKSVNNKEIKLNPVTKDLIYICEKCGINKENILKSKDDVKQIVKEYFKSTLENISLLKPCTKELYDYYK